MDENIVIRITVFESDIIHLRKIIEFLFKTMYYLIYLISKHKGYER